MHRMLICTLTVWVLGLVPVSSAWAVNSVVVGLSRIDNSRFPASQFASDLSVTLDFAATAVTAQAGSLALTLEESTPGNGEWEMVGDTNFASLAALQTAVGGTWTLTITGPPSSTSTFTLDAAALVDGNFFQTATNISPANGATNVSTAPLLSWVDPTGVVTPYVLILEVYSDLHFQDAVSIPDLGVADIPITATSWQPSFALPNGPIQFSVFYADADLPVLTAISAMQVTSGTITWGDSPFAPFGYPSATPLLALGSDTIVQFTVPEPSAALLSVAALATLGVLARRRQTAPVIH